MFVSLLVHLFNNVNVSVKLTINIKQIKLNIVLPPIGFFVYGSTDKTICVTAATAAARGKPVCVVTLADYVAVHGKLPGEETNASVGTGGVSKTPFGWREFDGLVRSFATDESETVYVGDSVSVFDEVHINLCYSWCVYAATNRHTRVVSILCKNY